MRVDSANDTLGSFLMTFNDGIRTNHVALFNKILLWKRICMRCSVECPSGIAKTLWCVWRHFEGKKKKKTHDITRITFHLLAYSSTIIGNNHKRTYFFFFLHGTSKPWRINAKSCIFSIHVVLA
jgi:ribosomal protein L40E